MIDSLLHALATSHLPLTDEEFADVLWLASYMDMPPNASTLASAPEAQPQPATPAVAQNRHQQPTKDQQAASTSGQPTTSAQAEVHLPKSSTHDKQRVEGMRALSFRSPAATALPGKLALARALRPILRKIPSSTQQELDEVVTAEQAAEEGRITPQLRPGRERWLDVAIVIDDWHTMAIWQQTIAEFIELLQQLGAFRTLQTYLLSTKGDGQTEQATLQLFTAQGFKRGRICPPSELVDPRGRRLTLILTDCTSPAWSSGAAGNLLSQWDMRNMVTLIQMLPADLWNSCALADAIQIAVSAPAPGIHNAKLAVERPWYWDDIWNEDRTPAMLSQPVPIITLEPEPLRRWTQAMVGKGGSKATAFYLPLQPARSPNPKTQTLSESLTPEERWRRFRATASPMAQELAGYLSAAPLSLPVMRLVQRVMLPQSRQVHLAEILRSELIQSSTTYDSTVNSDEMRYDFMEGIRELLLTTVLMNDTKVVLEKASEYISQKDYQFRNFHALILDPNVSGEFILDEHTYPIARIAITVLRRLDGNYAQLAKHLERSVANITSDIGKRRQSLVKIPVRKFRPFIIGRYGEVNLFDDLLHDRTAYHLLNIYGPGGIGKTVVCQMFQDHARAQHIPIAMINGLHPDLTSDRILYTFMEGLVGEAADESMVDAFKPFDRQYQDYLIVNQVLQQGGGIQALFDVEGNITDPGGLAAILGNLGATVNETAKHRLSNRYALERYLRGVERTLTASFIEGLNTGLSTRQQPVALLIDTYEEMEKLDDWVCRTFAPALPAGARMVILGNDQVHKVNFDWNEHDENVHALPLPELTEADAKSYLRNYGLTNAIALDKVYQFTGGYPLLLVLVRHLAREAGGWQNIGDLESSADRDRVATQLLERILRQESVAEVQAFLEKGVVARWFDPETISVILEVNLGDARIIYEKLNRHSFVERHPYGLKFHDKIRELLLNRLKFTHEHEYNRLTKRLTDYYVEKAGLAQDTEESSFQTTSDPVYKSSLVSTYPTVISDSTEVARLLQDQEKERQQQESDAPLPLTRRQMEVLRYLASGMSNSAIAEALHIEVGAVRGHISNIKKRLQLRYRWQVIDEAHRRGLVGNPTET